MPSPLVTATIQACLLNITSSILAQVLISYRSPAASSTSSSPYNPLNLDPTPIIHFLVFTVIITPVNFLFQQSLESALPAYPKDDPKTTKLKIDDGGEGVVVEKKLNIPNTILKIVVDQTVAAGMNTVAFLGIVPVLKGASTGQAWEGIKQEFWPLMIAGYKLWPAVSLLNYTVVPMENRVVVGSLVGLGWGIYLAMRSAT